MKVGAREVAFAAAVAWALAACGGSVVNLGSNDGGPGDGGASGSSGSSGGGTASSGSGSGGSSSGSGGGFCEPDASSPCLPSGTYTGYIESFTFPDGSDTLSMTIVANENAGAVTGTMVYGNAPMLAPPTSGDVGYPPGIAQTPVAPLEGFAFTIVGGTYGGARLQVGVVQNELWKAWCELETPVPQYNGASDGGCGPLLGYGCLGDVSTEQGTNGCMVQSCQQASPVPIDCGKMKLCTVNGLEVCTCTASACDVPVVAPGGIAFDMQFAPGHLDGTVKGLDDGQIHNVHLTGG